MTSVYTTRLAEVNGVVGSNTYTVPQGYVWVVTNIALTQSPYTSITTYGVARVGGPTFFLYAAPGDNSYHFLSWEGKVVLHQGEQLLTNIGPNPGYMVVTGYQFANA